MDIVAEMRILNWNYSFSDFMAMCSLTIYNTGDQSFDDLYIGLWNNTVVRNVNITPAGAGGATFYSQGGNGFVDSLNLAYCYDATGDEGFTDSYVGQVFLGGEDKQGFRHPRTDSSFRVNYNAWVFNNSGWYKLSCMCTCYQLTGCPRIPHQAPHSRSHFRQNHL